ncbi:MAG: hypothetical protein GXY58_08175 [Planctomycetaceae bacterium]|nr:hypothetical protein [Planctomycetaceae bacterium]
MSYLYYATFPGLQITRADFLFTHGITPSTAVVYAVAMAPGASVGDLVFMCNEQMLMTFKDCAIVQSTLTPPSTMRGFRMRLAIADRRWKWRYQLLSGRYNVRKADNMIRQDTSRTYRELLEIVLQALGETQYTITLPEENLEAPEVDWYRQRADLQLAWLCDRIGCMITLGLDNAIHVCPNGEGPIYPPNGLEFQPYINTYPADYPAEVRATFAPTRFQMKVKLEAVGLDTDGEVKPIADLSYAVDWETEVPGIWGAVSDGEERQLARDTVYRWYRVSEFAGGGLDLPVDEYTITSIDDILPILPGLVTATEDNYPTRPYVEGYFFNGDLKDENEEEGGFARWDDAFVLDHEHGIVKFPYPVYNLTAAGWRAAPELYLTCAFQARSDPMAGWWGYEYPYALDLGPVAGYGHVQVEQPDSFQAIVQHYEETQPTDITENTGHIAEQGAMLARSFAKHYEAVPQMSMQWNGIIPYAVCGNVHAMRWKCGGGPAMTWGGRNLSYNTQTPSYAERRIRNEGSRRLHLC